MKHRFDHQIVQKKLRVVREEEDVPHEWSLSREAQKGLVDLLERKYLVYGKAMVDHITDALLEFQGWEMERSNLTVV